MRECGVRPGIVAALAGCALFWFAACGIAATDTPPRILSEADRKQFLQALKSAGRDKWRTAISSAQRVSHSLAAALIEWLRLRRQKANVPFADIKSFLDGYPNWPGRAALMRRAEERMPDTFFGPATRAWFIRFPPLTGPGKQRLAEALIADGDIDAGRQMLRDAWINADFPADQEKRFLSKHKALFGVDDHNLRLDRLLWDGRRHAARRLLGYAGEDHRRLAEARLALMERKRGVDAAISRVPRGLVNHPGLTFERVRWRRRSGKDSGARALLLDPPTDLGRPGKCWYEQSYQIRQAIEDGLFDDAYAIASRHGQIENGPFSDAEWLAGWLALRFLNDPVVAESHFTAMYDRVRYPISRARAAYWIGRAARAAAAEDRATIWFRLAARHPTTFYGQLASQTLSLTNHLQVDEPSSVTPELRDRFEARPVVQAARILGEAGDFDTLQTFAIHLSRGARTPSEHLLVSQMGLTYGAPHISVKAAKRASRSGVHLVAYNYPISFGEAEVSHVPNPPELALLLGLVRQESEMNPLAVSRAGAYGLMQLKPSTAKWLSRALGVAYSKSRLTRDPGYNITLGSAYLSRLLVDYGGAYALALAAYNAGPSRVEKWLRTYGDPRGGVIDPIDWIELVPFSETRNYIQRVLESALVYRSALNGAPKPDRYPFARPAGHAGCRGSLRTNWPQLRHRVSAEASYGPIRRPQRWDHLMRLGEGHSCDGTIGSPPGTRQRSVQPRRERARSPKPKPAAVIRCHGPG